MAALERARVEGVIPEINLTTPQEIGGDCIDGRKRPAGNIYPDQILDPNHRLGDPELIFPIEDPGYWRQVLGGPRVERVRDFDFTPPQTLDIDDDRMIIKPTGDPILNNRFDRDREISHIFPVTGDSTMPETDDGIDIDGVIFPVPKTVDPILAEWFRTHGDSFGLESLQNETHDPGENTEPPRT